jgi:hypothetical protein
MSTVSRGVLVGAIFAAIIGVAGVGTAAADDPATPSHPCAPGDPCPPQQSPGDPYNPYTDPANPMSPMWIAQNT